MQTFESLLLQNYSTEFLGIAKNSPWPCVNKICHVVMPLLSLAEYY